MQRSLGAELVASLTIVAAAVLCADSARCDTPPTSSAPADAETQKREFYGRVLDIPADNVRASLEEESRPAADRARDTSENIEAVLRASGIQREMRVADVQAGDGYLAQLLGPAVKWFGKVWANNDPASLDAATAAAWKKRLDDPSTADIARLDNPLASPFPRWADRLDIVFSRGAYHDAIARAVDRAAMNAAIFSALAPGGKYVVVDARSANGAAPDAAAKLCRVPEALVRKEVEAAGFRLAGHSDALQEKSDSASQSACAAAGSGPWDRFLLVFEKPKAEEPAPK